MSKPTTYDLVFEGGGAKGMVFVGAYDAFTKGNLKPGRLLGTSAGAITATLVAAGYTPEEMRKAICDPVFATFMGPPTPAFTKQELSECDLRRMLRSHNNPLIPDIIEQSLDDTIVDVLAKLPNASHLFAFVERGGWFGADSFMTWLKDRLEQKQTGFSGMTLAQFHQATNTELTVVASDTTAGQILILNHRTAPNCPLSWAVRMSMSIPFVWNEVLWHPEWGTYLQHDITSHAIVDGGILSNFPLELFISDDAHVQEIMGKKSSDVIGMLIDDTLTVCGAPHCLPPDSSPLDQLRVIDRIKRLIDTAMTAHDKMVIEEFEQLVVRLPAEGYGTTEFNMSPERRDALVRAGYNAMIDYIDKRTVASALSPRTANSAAEQGTEAALATRQDYAKHTANRIALGLLKAPTR